MNHKLLLGGGLLLIAAALCLSRWNLRAEGRAAQAAREALVKLEQQTAQPSPPPREGPSEPESEPELPAYRLHPEMEMPEVEIDAVAYIGVLEVPALELTLPVISRWSDALLETAPCRYVGSAYQNDLIIAGHNYRGHFGSLHRLSPGDQIRFTDTAGNHFTYAVAQLQELPGTAIQEMEAGDWDLTLFTCTASGAARLTVRCTLTGEGG